MVLPFSKLISMITVEPIIFLTYMALAIFSISQDAVIYKTVCVQHHQSSDPYINCDNLRSDPHVEDQVQKSASNWRMILSLTAMIPAIVMNIFWGAWSDRHGRKIGLLFGSVGLALTALSILVIACSPDHMPMYALIITGLVCAFLGDQSLIMISSFSYLADVVHDKDSLTFRLTLLYIGKNLSEVIGSFALNRVLQILKPSKAILISQCIFAIGFFYTLIRIKQIPPDHVRKIAEQKSIGYQSTTDQSIDQASLSTKTSTDRSDQSISTSSKSAKTECLKTWQNVRELYTDVWLTVTKPRDHHKRAYIGICVFIHFCYMMAEASLGSGPLLSLFAFRRPFSWTASELGMYRAVQTSFMLLANILGACVMKKWLRGREWMIVLFGLASSTCHMILTGVATTGWMLYLGAFVGSFSALLTPSLKAFLAKQVQPNEVGKIYAANGITIAASYFCNLLIFNNIYSATITFYAGFAFLLGAVVMFTCLCLGIWIYVDSKKNMKLVKMDQEKAVGSDVTTALA